MIPADIEPSLRSAEPARESLDDGFSPPPQPQDQDPFAASHQAPPADATLGTKSPF